MRRMRIHRKRRREVIWNTMWRSRRTQSRWEMAWKKTGYRRRENSVWNRTWYGKERTHFGEGVILKHYRRTPSSERVRPPGNHSTLMRMDLSRRGTPEEDRLVYTSTKVR